MRGLERGERGYLVRRSAAPPTRWSPDPRTRHTPQLRLWKKITDEIVNALGQRSAIASGADKADFVIRTLARHLLEVRRARAELAEQFETELGEHPDEPILMSLPGVGCRTAVTMLVEISSIDRFANAGHLAVYAGVAPRTHRSGTSIKGEHHRNGGNSRLKRAMYLSAFASLRDPQSCTYYDSKRAEGKNHRSALICLARRRSDVLYSMLNNGTTYQPDRTNPGATLARDAIGSPEIEVVGGLRGVRPASLVPSMS